MNLVIDIGNTAVKVYLFKNNEIFKKEVLNENNLIHSLKSYPINDISNIICSSVTKSYKDQLSEIFEKSNYYDFSHNKLKLPFKNNYVFNTTKGINNKKWNHIFYNSNNNLKNFINIMKEQNYNFNTQKKTWILKR